MFAAILAATLIIRNKQKQVISERLLSQEFKEAADKAGSASRAKSEFLSNMSHDIRTPINGIMGMTMIAKKNVKDPVRTEDCLDRIMGASEHLLSLINNVLDMSRIESGQTIITRKSINLKEIVEECVSIIRGQASDRSLNIQSEFNVTHRVVLGDEVHLRQILINLLGNAVKFTPDNGSIFLRVLETRSNAFNAFFRFEVQDTGIGMKPEFVKQVFEPFTQAENDGRSKYKGTGLGMAIAKKLVELMNGTIQVKTFMEREPPLLSKCPWPWTRTMKHDRKKTLSSPNRIWP